MDSKQKAPWAALALAVIALLALPIFLNHPPAEAAPKGSAAVNVAKQRSVAETGGADILATDLQPGTTARPCLAYRISVLLETGSVFNVQIKNAAGADPIEGDLWNGISLTAGRWYTCVLGVNNAYKYNFEAETSGDVTLLVDEVYGGEL